MKNFGLIGYPLGHSFSVPYFTKKFADEGIQATYRNYPLQDISEVEALLQPGSGLSGLNVTVPYKQQIIPYLDKLSETAKRIGAVNTICFGKKGGDPFLTGYNTDVDGFDRSLSEHLEPHHTAALVLGTGGSSRAVTYVLEKNGIDYLMVSRRAGESHNPKEDHHGATSHKGRANHGNVVKWMRYEELSTELIGRTPLIINTTPLGMHPNTDQFPAIPYSALTSRHLLFDLVYNPAKTKFLALGEEKGASIVNGYDMLIYQAEASWKIWNKMK